MTATPFGNSMGPGSKFGIVVVDFQRGFTDPSATYGMDLDSADALRDLQAKCEDVISAETAFTYLAGDDGAAT